MVSVTLFIECAKSLSVEILMSTLLAYVNMQTFLPGCGTDKILKSQNS